MTSDRWIDGAEMARAGEKIKSHIWAGSGSEMLLEFIVPNFVRLLFPAWHCHAPSPTTK